MRRCIYMGHARAGRPEEARDMTNAAMMKLLQYTNNYFFLFRMKRFQNQNEAYFLRKLLFFFVRE